MGLVIMRSRLAIFFIHMLLRDLICIRQLFIHELLKRLLLLLLPSLLRLSHQHLLGAIHRHLLLLQTLVLSLLMINNKQHIIEQIAEALAELKVGIVHVFEIDEFFVHLFHADFELFDEFDEVVL